MGERQTHVVVNGRATLTAITAFVTGVTVGMGIASWILIPVVMR